MPRQFSVLMGIAIIAWVPTAAIGGHELENRDIAAGEVLYRDHCAACHGVNLQGERNWQFQNPDGTMPAPPHDETGHTWHHDNELLFEYTRLGGEGLMAARGSSGFKSGMPGFEDILSDDDIWNILAFIRSTWPERVKEVQAMRNLPHE